MEQTVSVGYHRKGSRKTLVVCDFLSNRPASTSPLFSPRGAAKCVEAREYDALAARLFCGARSQRAASRLFSTLVLKPTGGPTHRALGRPPFVTAFAK